jgi:multidrug efflux pump subunit AcrB
VLGAAPSLAATWGTIVLTGYLYVVIPEGYFPQQDTGFILAVSEAASDISFPAMLERQSRLADIVLKERGVDSVMSQVGIGGVNQTVNNGRMFVSLKPRDERDANASEIIDRLRPKLAQLQGITLFTRRTSMWARGLPARNISTPFRIAISTNSITNSRGTIATAQSSSLR